MYNFSKSSQSKLDETHCDLQKICNELIKYIDFTVVTGYRNPGEQLKKYNEGFSKVKKGKHNYKPSLAVDIQPYPLLSKTKGKSPREQFYFLAGFFMGIAKQLKAEGHITHDIRFGGDWDKDGEIADNGFDDLYHFELVWLK